MSKELKKYSLKLSVLTLIVASTGSILFFSFLKNYYLPVFWWLLIFFFFIHMTGHIMLVYTNLKKKMNFANAYMLSFAFKFVSYIVFLVIYLNVHETNKLVFALYFLVLYVIYTFFEVKATITFSKSINSIIEK